MDMYINMTLTPENTVRKVDNLGRVCIPKGVRDRFNINTNDDLQFFTLEHEGRFYVCMTNMQEVNPKYRATAEVLEELGIEVPDKLRELL